MRVELRASAAFVARLDALAAARGLNRSAAVRAAVVEASPEAPPLPPPPDRDELLRLLGAAARGGSVAAIRLLLAELRRDRDAAAGSDPDGLDFIDQLAARRASSKRPAALTTANGNGATA